MQSFRGASSYFTMNGRYVYELCRILYLINGFRKLFKHLEALVVNGDNLTLGWFLVLSQKNNIQCQQPHVQIHKLAMMVAMLYVLWFRIISLQCYREHNTERMSHSLDIIWNPAYGRTYTKAQQEPDCHQNSLQYQYDGQDFIAICQQ